MAIRFLSVRSAYGPHSGPYVPLIPRSIVVNREIELVEIHRWRKLYSSASLVMHRMTYGSDRECCTVHDLEEIAEAVQFVGVRSVSD